MDPAQRKMETGEGRRAPALVIPMPSRSSAPGPVRAETPRQVPADSAEPGEEPGYGHGV